MSDTRSFGSNYQRCSQSRKMSIGIAADLSAKKSDFTGNRYNRKGQKGSPWISPKPLMRSSRTLSEFVNTATKVANTTTVDGACSNQLGGVNEPTAGTSSRSGNVKPKKVDIVAPGKENIKEVTTERGKGSTQEAVEEISVPNEGVKQQKPMENRGKETLKMKLWEVLRTVPPATRELEGSRSDDVDANVMMQKDGSKEDASLKPWVNSDTIETDSENPVVAVSRHVTRSLSRKRGPAVASPKRLRKKLFPAKEEWNVFTFEGKCCRTPATVSGEHKDNTPEAGHFEKQMPCQSKQVKVPPRFHYRELSPPFCYPNEVPTVEGSGDESHETDTSLEVRPAEKHISSSEKHISAKEERNMFTFEDKCYHTLYAATVSGEHKDTTPEVGHFEKQMPCQSKQVKVPPRFNYSELSPPVCFSNEVPTVEGSGDESHETDTSLDVRPAEKHISSPGHHGIHEEVNCNDPTVEGSRDETDTSLDVRLAEKHISSPGRHDIHEEVNYNDPTIEGSGDETDTSLDVHPAEKHISSPGRHDIHKEVNYTDLSPFCSPNATRLTEASQEYEDGLDRAVALFGSSLEEFKNKLVSSTKKRSSEILESTAEEIHSKFQSAKSLIEKDVTKLTSASRSKRQILEKNFDEKQEQLRLIHDKFRDEIHCHLQEFTRTVECLQAHETELKGVIERRKVSHQKLLLQVDEAVENHLSDAQRRLFSIQNAGRSKMQNLKTVISECLEDGIFT